MASACARCWLWRHPVTLIILSVVICSSFTFSSPEELKKQTNKTKKSLDPCPCLQTLSQTEIWSQALIFYNDHFLLALACLPHWEALVHKCHLRGSGEVSGTATADDIVVEALDREWFPLTFALLRPTSILKAELLIQTLCQLLAVCTRCQQAGPGYCSEGWWSHLPGHKRTGGTVRSGAWNKSAEFQKRTKTQAASSLSIH